MSSYRANGEENFIKPTHVLGEMDFFFFFFFFFWGGGGGGGKGSPTSPFPR